MCYNTCMRVTIIKNKFKFFLFSEIGKYFFWGVLTTIVYFVARTVTYLLFNSATISSALASIIAILFAFFTNDLFVFNQSANKRINRLIKFCLARMFTLVLDMFLAWLLVEHFPNIIGSIVNYNMQIVNMVESIIAQFLIFVFNYLISKLLVFKN